MNLYIALTPYHILLTLLHSNRQPGDKVIVVDQSGTLIENYTCLRKYNLYHATWEFIEDYKISSIAKAVIFGRLELKFIIPEISSLISIIKKQPYDTVYVFNDTPIIVQYLISCLDRNSVVYVEDGVAPYNSHKLHSNIFIKAIKNIFFGKFYDWKPILGTSKYIQSGTFTYKELVREENRVYPLHDYILVSDGIQILRSLASELGLSITENSKSKNALILLPNFSAIKTNEWLNHEFIELISHLSKKDWNIYLKFHPLDYRHNETDKFKACKIIPQYAPAEIVPALLSSLQVVVGTETTSLSSIKFIYRNLGIKIFSIGNDRKVADLRLLDFFSKIGIKLCVDYIDVLKEINSKESP